MSILYSRIDDLCKMLGISITNMCKDAGVSRASLSDLKVGRKQTLSSVTLDKIADYFDTTVDYLLGRTDDPEGFDRFGLELPELREDDPNLYECSNMCDLYKNIEALCAHRGISVYRLCKDIGIRGSVMSDLKTGRKKSLSTKTLTAIAEYFDVSTDYLLTGEEAKKPAAEGSELDKQLEGVDFALYGEVKDLTDAQKRDVLRFIQFLKQED